MIKVLPPLPLKKKNNKKAAKCACFLNLYSLAFDVEGPPAQLVGFILIIIFVFTITDYQSSQNVLALVILASTKTVFIDPYKVLLVQI